MGGGTPIYTYIYIYNYIYIHTYKNACQLTRGDPSEGALPHATFVAMLRGGALNKGELMAIGLLNTFLFIYSDKREIKGKRRIRGIKEYFF